MNLRDLQKEVSEDYMKRTPARKTVFHRLLSLLSELGELAACILTNEGMRLHKPADTEREYADLLMNVLSLGTLLKLDAEEVLQRKLREDISNRRRGAF